MLYVVRSIETVVAADPMLVKDTFYISHGAPMLATNESLPASQFFRSWREKVYSQRPKSILMISAHWDTSVPTVNVVDQLNDTIHDFNEIIRSIRGFSEDLYELSYPAPGAPELAKRVKEVLLASGFERVDEERNRGLDHSAWVPLMMMYPDADIPVCQLSLQLEKDGTYHYNLGKALAPLREEGVLIIGSGNTTHNVNSRKHYDGTIAPWASAFDTWLRDALLEGRYEDVNQYEEKAPNPKMAHPSPDHFYPLHVAMGAAGENAKAELIHQSWSLGTLSYSSYKFTAAN